MHAWNLIYNALLFGALGAYDHTNGDRPTWLVLGDSTPVGRQMDAMDGYTREEIFVSYLNCGKFDDGMPIPTESTWMILRDLYQEMFPHRRLPFQPTWDADRQSPKYVIQHSPHNGRGMFAAQDISKGELVWTAKSDKAVFTSGRKYRRFLRSLPPELACGTCLDESKRAL